MCNFFKKEDILHGNVWVDIIVEYYFIMQMHIYSSLKRWIMQIILGTHKNVDYFSAEDYEFKNTFKSLFFHLVILAHMIDSSVYILFREHYAMRSKVFM